jgi:hypothetical protein
MRRGTISLLTAGLVLLASAHAEAARVLFTPPLAADPSGGSLYCLVTNTVDKPVSFVIDVLDDVGASVNQQVVVKNYPSGNPSSGYAGSFSTAARSCRVAVSQGNAKNLRVTLEARSPQGGPTAAVEAR